jgi:hypothetical protein
MIFCGEAQVGSASSAGTYSQVVQRLLKPVGYGTTDVDLITGTETFPNVTQSTTFIPDNPLQIVVAYNDTRCRNANPINISGASVSEDGGTTFTRLTQASGCSPFSNTVGDPVVLYSRHSATWYTIWLDLACGGQGLGGYKSTTPSDPNSWTHFCVFSEGATDRESGWVDNNSSSPHYGNIYISWNDFNVGCGGGGCLFVRVSTDDGNTWTSHQITSGSPFIRDVQITGDLVTGDVYIAGMDEGGGGLAGARVNRFYRSTDGGNTWTNTYIGPSFFGPGRCGNGYFACMYCSPSPGWPHMGWGEPAASNHVVHYVYAQCGQNVACNTATDHGDVYYIRSTDSGVTFATPVKLNTDTGTAAQWEPNLSVSPSGTVFAVWYDERTGGTCKAGVNTPCYQMFARKSTDNGVTWLPDMAFSDVVSPLPAQPETGNVGGSDYDYQIAVATSHRTAWVDGRVAINGIQQQDVFFDSEPSVAGTPTPTPTAPPCSVTSPTCGSLVTGTPPTDFIITLSDLVDPATVQASDLTVNGIPADSVVVSNGNTTIDFFFNASPVVEGVNTMQISPGAFNCGGGPVAEFTCTFRYKAPRVTPTPRPHPTPLPRP